MPREAPVINTVLCIGQTSKVMDLLLGV